MAKNNSQNKIGSKKVKKIQSQKHILKDCFINIARMTKKEYEMYSKSDSIITKEFNLRISGKKLEINNKQFHLHNHSIQLKIQRQLSELVLDYCQEIPTIEVARETRQNTSHVAAESLVSKISAQPKAIAKTLNSLINENWRKLKKGFRKQTPLELGDIVMAKMSGYCPWAAKFEGLTVNKKRARVLFFGTNDRGTVDCDEIVPFIQSHSVIRLLLLRNVGQFHKSIVEVERLTGVPPELSITNGLEMIAGD